MKQARLARRMLLALLMPAVGYCTYPTVEEAQSLFTAELMNSTNVIMTGVYDDFRCRLVQPVSTDGRRAVESIVLDAVTSIVVHVSTNIIDESVGVRIIENRGIYFDMLGYSMFDFQTNAAECVRLAEYIGSVREADFSSSLAKSRGFAVRMFLSTNETEMVELRLREEELQRERKKMQDVKRHLQIRVLEANTAVRRYRRGLLSLCGKSVAGCRRIMSDEEFTVFTNELVTVSHATKDEQRGLFWDLKQSSH